MAATYDFVRVSDHTTLHGGSVLVTSGAIERFADRWPCSGLRDLDAGVVFSYAGNGDLVDIEWFSAETGGQIAEPIGIDESAMVALSHDAQLVAFDPFHDCTPCHVEPYNTILTMYLYGALQPGETL